MKRYIAIFLSLIWILPLFACSEEEVVQEGRTNFAVATVNAVGDIYLTDTMLSHAKRANGYDFTPMFEDVILSLSQADLTIGNFEGNFIGRDYAMENGSYPNEFAQELYRIGFDILQTANSYSIFNGLTGLQSTKSVIEESGMNALGTYTSAKDRDEHQVIVKDVNGVRIAFIAMTKGLGNLALPEDTECGVDILYEDYTTDYTKVDESAVTALLKKAKDENPDVIIAALHWGSENQEEISQSQEEIADLMLRNGVDVILGSHSHIASKIEKRNVTLDDGSQKECVIAYSLGDFCAINVGECNTSLILNLEFTRNGNKTSISKVGYTPISAVDCGTGTAKRYSVMVTKEEIDLYESNYYDRVSLDIYETFTADLENLKKKLDIEE